MRRAMLLVVLVMLLSGPALGAATAPATRPETTLTGAALIPDAYGGFFGLVAGPDLPQTLARLRALAGAPAAPEAVIQEVAEAIFPDSGINYAADIAPWLGDEMAVGVDPTTLEAEPDFVALIATTNTTLSDAFVQKLIVYLGSQGEQIAPIVHQNVVVYAGQRVALATFNGYVAYGSLDGVKGAIDVSAGQATPLMETVGFQQAASGLSSNALASAYLSGEALKGALASVGVDLSPLLGEVSVTGMGMAFSSEGQPPAARLDLSLGWSQSVDGPVLNTATAGTAVAQAVPQDALGFLASYDVRWPIRIGLYLFAAQIYLNQVSEALATGAPPPQAPTGNQLAAQANGLIALANLTLAQQLGGAFDLEENLLKWMSGEYAIAFLRNPSGLYGDPRIPADVAAMTQVIDRNATLNTVEIINRLLASQLGLTSVAINLGGYDLRAVPDPATGGNLFVYGLVGDFLVIATGNSIEQMINVANGATPNLAANATWQARAAAIEPATEGVLYFPVSDFVSYARASLTGDLLAEFEAFNAPTLEPYDYVLATADMREGGLWTLSVLITAK